VNQITILDLYLMHAQDPGNHQSNMSILKSMYERTHHYYITIFTAVLALIAGTLGSLIALLTLQEIRSGFAIGLLIAAPISLFIPLFILRTQIGKLHRDYLDVLQIYNLLSQYF
jgi:hypothetical protein